MDYTYEVPITVYYNDDEGEHLIPTKKDVVELVSRKLADSWRGFFIDEVDKVFILSQRDRMLITIRDNDLLYNKDVDQAYRITVEEWMRYGDFGGGFALMGRFYNYSHDEVIVYTYDSKLPIISKTKATDVESRS